MPTDLLLLLIGNPKQINYKKLLLNFKSLSLIKKSVILDVCNYQFLVSSLFVELQNYVRHFKLFWGPSRVFFGRLVKGENSLREVLFPWFDHQIFYFHAQIINNFYQAFQH